MNKLDTETRALILRLLVEGNSIRATSRIADVSTNTVSKLLIDAGEACSEYHDATVRDVKASVVQCDEIWSFCYAKQKNVAAAKSAPEGAGDTWTWTALDSESKLIVSYMVGGREVEYLIALIDDVRLRLANRVQLTTDGRKAYLEAVDGAFGDDVEYDRLMGLYGEPMGSCGDGRKYSPSYVERQSLTMRTGIRRLARLTNGFSKKLENHEHMLSLYCVHYNFVRVHKSLRVTPAMAAGASDTLHDMEWIVGLIDARAPAPKKRGPYRERDLI